MTRIVQLTDLHWFIPPKPRDLLGKRLIGTANLYVRNRRHHFSSEVADQAVAFAQALKPDALVVTGDLTAQALPDEFARAYQALKPALDTIPSLIQRGNHDVYTRPAAREDRIASLFSPWLHRGAQGIARLDRPGVCVIGLDPNRPHPLASGQIPQAQLDALPALLDAIPASQAILLALHYPVVDRTGALYDGLTHGLRNAPALIDTLMRATRLPDLIIHGHVHHGYRATLHLPDGRTIPSANPGASGYNHLPELERAACLCVHTFEGGAYLSSERYRHNGQDFAPEPGGPWATGR